MAVSPRLIKRRIRSISNTRKITKAMELVAASKMRKTVQMTTASREYASSIANITQHIRAVVDQSSHPLLTGNKDAHSTLVIVAASDRSLCGGFNAQVLKKTIEFLASRRESIQIITVGKRAELAVKRTGKTIVASFSAIADAPSFERSRPIGEFAYQAFLHKEVDRVFMVYTDFKSALSQVPTITQLLPITPEGELNEHETHAEEPTILFEPDAEQILNQLLPRLIETHVYQALLESSASEHAARMLAMRNATESATEMIDDLTLTFNQARQANITREISEISAGKAALE